MDNIINLVKALFDGEGDINAEITELLKTVLNAIFGFILDTEYPAE